MFISSSVVTRTITKATPGECYPQTKYEMPTLAEDPEQNDEISSPSMAPLFAGLRGLTGAWLLRIGNSTKSPFSNGGSPFMARVKFFVSLKRGVPV